MTDTNETQVEVTQADRDAANAIVGLPANPAHIDSDRVVQAFARHRIQAEKRTAPRQVVKIDWDEIRQAVESACDDPNADLQWAVDIVRDELGGQLASLATQNNALAVELRAKFGGGEFYVNGDTFDLIFRPAGGSFASSDKIVARMACGESAFILPQIVAGMLNAALEGDE